MMIKNHYVSKKGVSIGLVKDKVSINEIKKL